MLKLDNYFLSFEGKDIFCNALFISYKGQMTVITGESGVGKSTLLNSLCYKNTFRGQYIFEDQMISEFDKQKKKEFIADNIYYIEQSPHFIDDLTIEEHYQLYCSKYDELDYLNTIDILNISNLLSKHPNQLSDGEKKRVSISLGILSHCKILIIDEPTASLNDEYVKKVGELLRKYAKNGNYVIVSSHDLLLQDYADMVYVIEKQAIKHLVNPSVHEADIQNRPRNKINARHMNYFSMYKYHIKKRKAIFIITILLVALIGVCFEFNNKTLSVHKDLVNNVSSTEIVVYKSGEDKDSLFSYDGEEYPISEKEAEYLKDTPYLKKMDWRFDMNGISRSNENAEDINLGSINNESMNSETILYDKETPIKKGYKDENVFSSMVLQTYTDTESYSQQIAYQFKEKNGVYLSKNLALSLVDDPQELEGKELEFPYYIPISDKNGVSSYTTDSGKTYEVNYISTMKKTARLPISGVLENNYFYDTDVNLGFQNLFLIPQSFLSVQITFYRSDYKATIYVVVDNDEKYIYENELPQDKRDKVILATEISPWLPNCYVLQLEDLTHLEDALLYIQEIGLNARCVYLNTYSLQQSVQSMLNSVKVFGCALLCILFAVNNQINKLRLFQEEKSNLFLMNSGLSNKEVYSINLKKYFVHFICDSVLSMIVAIIIIYIFNSLLYGVTHISVMLICIIIGIHFINDFLLPNIGVRKWMKNIY